MALIPAKAAAAGCFLALLIGAHLGERTECFGGRGSLPSPRTRRRRRQSPHPAMIAFATATASSIPSPSSSSLGALRARTAVWGAVNGDHQETASSPAPAAAERPLSPPPPPPPRATSRTRILPHAFVADRTRGDFPILSRTVTDRNLPLVYLDSAATSQKPRRVLEAVGEYYARSNANVHRGAHELSREATEAYEAARDKVAAFVGAPSRNEVVFTSGATESLNLVAQSYGRAFLSEGDEIVLTVAEHHANLVPWQMLAAEKNLTVRYVAIDPATGGLDLDHMGSLLGPRTKLVGFQHVSNVLGCVNPVGEMVALVRSRCPPDAKIVLDACQSVPHMPVNVRELGVDFVAASGHKMCGPTGIGFLWGREDLLNRMPPWQGGGEMIDRVTLEGSTFLPAPARFEAGTPPIAQAVGLGAAIDYLTEVGMDQIEAYERELAGYLYDRMSQVPGIRIFGPPRGSQRVALCAFAHEGVHSSDLSSFLDVEGIAVRSGHHCCQPLHQESLLFSHSARASLYFYNTAEEIDVFVEKLKSTIEFFTGLAQEASVDAKDSEDFVPFI